jgi:hypothetical protein
MSAFQARRLICFTQARLRELLDALHFGARLRRSYQHPEENFIAKALDLVLVVLLEGSVAFCVEIGWRDLQRA